MPGVVVQGRFLCTASKRPPSLKSAMRRFYKKVHPDRFHAHPELKSSNEKSMQQLQELLLIPGSGQDTTRSGMFLHQNLVSTVANNIDLHFYVHNEEAYSGDEKNEGQPQVRLVKEQFRAGHLPRELLQSSHKHHVRKVQDVLVTELKRALVSLFEQAKLPSNFELAAGLYTDQLFGGGPTEPLDDETMGWESAKTAETVKKISIASFFQRFHGDALQRMQRRAELERKAGMNRAVLHMQRNLLVHFLFRRQFMQSCPLPPYGAYDDDDASGQGASGGQHHRMHRASTDIYGDSVVERQCEVLQQFVPCAAAMPERIRDCVILFTDDAEDADLIDVRGRIVLPYNEGETGWMKRLKEVNMDQVRARRSQTDAVAAAERKVAKAIGFRLVCAATPELAVSTQYRDVLDRLAAAKWKERSDGIGLANRELYQRISILVCEDNATDALTANPDVGLIIPPSVTKELLEELIDQKAGWCGRLQLVRESSAEREGQLVMEMKRRLRLVGLKRDTNCVSAKRMLDCCIRLRSLTDNSTMDVSGLSIVVADRYRIMDDGTVIVPWNFVN